MTETREEKRELSVAKSWEKADIGNAFLFGKVFTTNPDLLLELLQCTVPELHIQSIESATQEACIKTTMDSHGVRLDILVRDEQGRFIDVEMQLQDERNLPKRMRYYGSSIDQMALEQGQDYSQLKDALILFITLFDPFDLNLRRYTFRNYCEEDRKLTLGDGFTKVVLNATGVLGEVSRDAQEILDLVRGLKTYRKDSLAARIDQKVEAAKQNAAWRQEYMNYEMTIRHAKFVAREEGLAEGRVEGLAEGRAEGEAIGIYGTVSILRDIGIDDETIIQKIREQYSLTQEQAEEYVRAPVTRQAAD